MDEPGAVIGRLCCSALRRGVTQRRINGETVEITIETRWMSREGSAMLLSGCVKAVNNLCTHVFDKL